MAQTDVPTAQPDDALSKLKDDAKKSGWNTIIVVNPQNIVLGRIYASSLDSTDEHKARDVMRDGPSTFRPNVSAEEMLAYMNRHELKTALVTTSARRLIGVALKQDLETAAERS